MLVVNVFCGERATCPFLCSLVLDEPTVLFLQFCMLGKKGGLVKGEGRLNYVYGLPITLFTK